MDMISDWDNWKNTLGRAINLGSVVGINDENIVNIGSRIGDFLNQRVDPGNPEQRVIKELWDVASEEEQKSLTTMLVKMIKTENEVKEGTLR